MAKIPIFISLNTLFLLFLPLRFPGQIPAYVSFERLCLLCVSEREEEQRLPCSLATINRKKREKLDVEDQCAAGQLITGELLK